MAKKAPTYFDDLKPRSREVLVGDVVMLVAEPTSGQFMRAMKLVEQVFDYAQFLKGLVGSLFGEDGERIKGEALVGGLLKNLESLAVAAKHLAGDLLGIKVPELAALAVVTPENARRLAAHRAATEGGDHVPPAPEVLGMWVTENMTLRQGVVVLDALVEVTDVSDLVGKSRGLIQRTRGALRPAQALRDGTTSPA